MPIHFTTGNLSLSLFDEGDVNWWSGVDTNFDILDVAVSALQDEVALARGSRLTLNDRLSQELNTDGSLILRSTILATQAEVIAARGTHTSLKNRLAVSLYDNGTLRSGVLVQRSLANSLTYNDGYVGTPASTEDDLNRIRNELKVLKGVLQWETDVTVPVQTLINEIVTARGTLASLNARLSVSLAANGTFNPIPQTQVQRSATYNDQFPGTVINDLQDDLNRIRTMLRQLKDTSVGKLWTDSLTMTVKQIIDELQAARGSLTTVDSRLDVSLNEDGTIKSAVLGLQTGIDNSAVYDDSFVGLPQDTQDDLNRIRHELKIVKGTAAWTTTPPSDITVLDTLVQGLIAGLSNNLLDRADTTVLYPVDQSWQSKYRLHQFQGRESPLSSQKFWFNVTYQSPLTVQVGTGVGPGKSDDTNPGFALDLWGYLYIIGKSSDGTMSLVYSANSPQTGPSLTDALFVDYDAWRYIGEVVNGQAGSWELVPMRRHGLHVEYEQAQLIRSASGASAAWDQYSLAARVPRTSMNVNLMLYAYAHDQGSTDMMVRPASVVAAGERMLLQDLAPGSPKSQIFKLRAHASAAAAGEEDFDTVTGWCHTDNAQRIDIDENHGGAGDSGRDTYVLGYECLPDFDSTVAQWI